MGSLETMLRKYYASKYAGYFLLQRIAQSKDLTPNHIRQVKKV